MAVNTSFLPLGANLPHVKAFNGQYPQKLGASALRPCSRFTVTPTISGEIQKIKEGIMEPQKESQMEFNVGEVVRLKSGSPDLTVSATEQIGYAGSKQIEVTWLASNGIQRLTLPSPCFRPA